MSNKKQNGNLPANVAFHREADGSIHLARLVESHVLSEIPPGIYTLKETKDNFHLVPENNFKLPSRIYGDVDKYVDHFLKAYEGLDRNIGALLHGNPGSGKTITLKRLAHKFVEMGWPAIIITEPVGPALLPFLNMIDQHALVCFDEYEKTHGDHNVDDDDDDHTTGNASPNQRMMLQLLDGAFTSHKKFFVFTANEIKGISKYMFNRPSRIRYVIGYNNIEIPTVVDYVTANLKNCTERDVHAFVHLAAANREINFDTMVSLVDELNVFKHSLNEALPIMTRHGIPNSAFYEANIFVGGKHIGRSGVMGSNFEGVYVGEDEMAFKIGFNDLNKKAILDAEATQKRAEKAAAKAAEAAGKSETEIAAEQAMKSLQRDRGLYGMEMILSPRFLRSMGGDNVDDNGNVSVSSSEYRVWTVLGKQDFIGFGSEHDTLEFKMGDFQIVLKYIDSSRYHKLPTAIDITDDLLISMAKTKAEAAAAAETESVDIEVTVTLPRELQ